MTDKFSVDISAWLMRDYEAWSNAVSDGSISAMNEIMTTIIKAWPHESDPALTESYKAMTLLTWREVCKEVGKAISASFQIPG